MDRLYQARIAYRTAFDSEGHKPQGVADEDLAEALELAVHTRTPIETDRDWSEDRRGALRAGPHQNDSGSGRTGR